MWKREHGLSLAQQKDFASCRTYELKEGFTESYLNTLARYRALLNSILDTGKNVKVIKDTKSDLNSEFWRITKVWLELDLLISALSKEPYKSSMSLQQLLESFIFTEDQLGKSPAARLREATIQQKVSIIALLLTDREILEDFISKNKEAASTIETAKQKLKILSSSESKNLEEFEALCDFIFPLISSYFELAYTN